MLIKLDGNLSFGKWYTARHIETVGDDSVTHVPVGKKLMLIGKRGKASRRLESLMTSVKSVMTLLSNPATTVLTQTMKFYVSDPHSSMVQPAFSSQTLITLTNGPALVVGFEAKIAIENGKLKSCSII